MRPVDRLDRADQVDAEEVLPERGVRALRRGRSAPAPRACRSAMPSCLRAGCGSARSPADVAVLLVLDVEARAGAPLARPARAASGAATTSRCGCRSPGVARRTSSYDRRPRLERLLARRRGACGRRPAPRARASCAARSIVNSTSSRRQPVAEAAVDDALGRPERRERLVALVHVVELAAHHVAQDAAPPVRRLDRDPGDARRRQRAAGHGQVERVDRRRADDLRPVERRQRAVELEDLLRFSASCSAFGSQPNDAGVRREYSSHSSIAIGRSS